MSKPAVKVDEETHKSIRLAKAEILLDTDEEVNYGEIVRDAVKYYRENKGWKEVAVTQ